MTSEFNQTVDDIFHEVCELAPEKRAAYLDKMCSGDEQLRREVEDLLKHHETANTFLENNALHDAARKLARDLTLSESQPGSPDDTMRGVDWLIGPYRILDQIGKGGMGVVYLAEDTQHDRQVAIKLLPSHFKLDEDRLARFNREARMMEELKQLKHPNIAEIFEQTEFQGRPCLVLEYVPGETLADRIKSNGALTVAESLQVALQVADALVSAHHQHIVHRDLKPANVKITPQGQVKVLDFGLAKRFHPDMTDEKAGEFNTNSHSLTESGMLIGTPAYMSPEQWDGKEIDQRSDIWAFGCLLYEMLTGRQPFARETRSETMKTVLKDEPEWNALPSDTPIIVQDLLRRCLQKDVSLRPQNAIEARRAINEAIGKNKFSPILFVKSQSWRVKRHAKAISLIAMMIVLASVLAWYWKRISAVPEQKYIAVLPFEGFKAQQAGVGFAQELRRNLINTSEELRAAPPSDSLQTNLLGIEWKSIQQKLGANLIVSGDVRYVEDRIVIKYSVRNSYNYQVSEGRVEGPISSLSDLQYQIAVEIAAGLKLTKSANANRFSKHLNLRHADATEQYLAAIGELQKDMNKESVEKPIEILESLVNSEGDSARFQAALAQAYLNKYVFTNDPGWAKRALQACERAKSLAPDQPDVYLVSCGLVNVQFGKHQEAISDFNAALERHPGDWEALNGLAFAYESSGDSAKAAETYTKVINLWPNYWAGYNAFGNYYYSKGDYGKAIDNWRRVVYLLPDSPTGYNNLGAAYYQAGQESDAVEAYITSISKDRANDNKEAYAGLGTIYYYRGSYQEALSYFQKGLDLVRESGGKDAILLGNLGDTYRQMARTETVPNLSEEYGRRASDSYKQAVDIYKQSIDNKIEDGLGLATLAEWLAKLNNPGEALRHIKRAIDLDTENVEIAYKATIVYLISGDNDRALSWFEKACAGYNLPRLGHDPELERLRLDQRYQQTITKCQQRTN